MASFALIPTEKVKSVHVCYAASTGSLRGLVSIRFYLRPSILTNAVRVEIIQSFVIISTREQVDISVCEDALVARPGCKYLPLGMHLDPLIYLHLLEVVFRVLHTSLGCLFLFFIRIAILISNLLLLLVMIELIEVKKLLRLVIMSIDLLAKNRGSWVLTVHYNANVIVLSDVGLGRLYLAI